MMRPASRVATVAAGLCLALTGHAPAALAAEGASGNGFIPGGTSVNLSTASGQGTSLTPGLYATTLPIDETTRYISLTREEGERLEVSVVGSATWKNGAWTTSGGEQGLSLKLTTSDGATVCATDAQSVFEGSPPGLLHTGVVIDPTATKRTSSSSDIPACRAATSYRLEVSRTLSGDDVTDMPTQIAVVRTPKVAGDPSKQAADKNISDMPTTALTTTGSAEPGSGFADATPLPAQQAGYEVSAEPGRRLFYRVHLAWGQRMSVGWQVPKNGSDSKPKQDLDVSLQVFNPALMPTTLSGTASSTGYLFTASSGDGPEELGAYTAPIRYGNADIDSSGDEKAQWQSMPGWYYIVLDVTPNDSEAGIKNTDPLKTALSIRFAGAPKPGPTMSGVAEPDPGNLSGTGTGAGVNPILWGGAGLVGLAAVGGLGYIMWRRQRG